MSPQRYKKRKINGVTHSEHRLVWEAAHGPIPPGYHVHHVDHDKFNNDLGNLECVSTKDHGDRHTWRPVTKPCDVCGKTYRPHKTKRARSRTCSPECFSQLQKRLAQERYEYLRERDASIYEDKDAGMTNSDLAAKYEMGLPNVTRILKKRTEAEALGRSLR